QLRKIDLVVWVKIDKPPLRPRSDVAGLVVNQPAFWKPESPEWPIVEIPVTGELVKQYAVRYEVDTGCQVDPEHARFPGHVLDAQRRICALAPCQHVQERATGRNPYIQVLRLVGSGSGWRPLRRVELAIQISPRNRNP